MADILCPTCGKPNPEILEICQYCGTVLKREMTEPLAPLKPGEMPVKRKTSDLERTLPGWLRDIRKSETPPDPPAPKPAVSFGSNRVDAPGPVGQSSKPKSPNKANPSPLDLLAGLSQSADDEDSEVPDWLSDLKSIMPETPAPESPPEAQKQPATDWLADFRTDDPKPQQLADEPEIDWGFSGSRSFDVNEAAEPAAEISNDTPDWLTALKAQDQAVKTPAAPPDAEEFPTSADSSQFGDVPDWLKGLQTESSGKQTPPKPVSPPSEPAPALEFNGDTLPLTSAPDWLSNMAQESTLSAESAPIESAPAGDQSFGGDLPDWLSGLQDESPAQKPAPPAFTEPSAGDLSDWLSGLDQESAAPVEAAPAASFDFPAAGDLPDWLSGTPAETPTAGIQAAFQTAQPISAEPAPTAEPVLDDIPSDGDLPDWLAAAIGDKPAPPQPPIQGAPPTQPKPAKAFPTGALDDLGLGQTGETPDWLVGLQAAPAAETPKAAKPARPAPAPAPQEDSSPFGDMTSFGDLSTAADLPDWMSGLSDVGATVAGEEMPVETAGKAKAESESVVEKPEAAAPPVYVPVPTDEQNLDSMFSEDVPDWLSNFTPADNEAANAEFEQGATTSDLGQAELPSWVQAMRPMESMLSANAGDDDEQDVEKDGPLAGLRNVLPARLDLLEIRKPKMYSIKLQVTGTQQSQAALLEKMVASEALSHPISTPKRVRVIRSLRWVIAAVLLLAVLIPALLGSKAFPLPYIPPEETKIFKDMVDSLPDSAPVLVVFDYQPGYAGEMESAASPVIDHLINKNALLSFISSSPTGVLMGERMMAIQNQRRMETGQNPYEMGVQYVDLGYLPGGAAGIQVFANNPRATLGSDAVLGDLWALPALQGVTIDGITRLSNFATVIVLTDNPDTGRVWVEQAGPALADKPLMMVISAQAEPMIRPYYKSGQLRGMVTGLEGGAVYEQINLRPEQARQYWDSYGMGMIATEFLIVLGGAWALITGLRERRASQEEDEA